ncbi:hypothetical protein [Methylobacterium soli]|uniref:Uncharacterized protein n=1 Tax=Methylobacterium soli TaxID=553447 RepID=A0A6L3T076_9HYPH|nr:hypothetical protein [Methylobacterium soli]KAB1079325.1 hypothetical protein F6X53_10985 [Methylobacterium soli]GJE42973.1 hypothetical protein AEGHOMDF_2149 [Methylobacterium soli]
MNLLPDAGAFARLRAAVAARLQAAAAFRLSLYSNWLTIIRHAWSIRFMALSIAFSALEVAFPYLDSVIPVSRGTFGLLSALCTAAAAISRLVAQRKLPEGGE